MRIGMHERHHILQLITETVGSAGLVKAAAGPQSASDRLVHEPAVGENIEARIGRVDLRCAQHMPPLTCYRVERFMGSYRSSRTLHESARCLAVTRGAQPEDDLPLLTDRQIESNLERGAGI